MTGLSFFKLHPAFDIRGEPKSTVSVAAGERAQETEERKEPGRITWRQTQTSNFGLLGKNDRVKGALLFIVAYSMAEGFVLHEEYAHSLHSLPAPSFHLLPPHGRQYTEV